MVDLLKKTLYTGVGLAYFTKEAVEEAGRKIIKEANLSEEEGKKFLGELVKKSTDARIAFEKTVHDAVGAVLKRLDIPGREEMNEVNKRLATLEKSGTTEK